MTVEKVFTLIVCALVLSGCVSNENELVEFKLEPPSDNFYLESFERNVNRLGLYRVKEADGIEQALVVVNASFDAMIGLSLVRDVIDKEDDKFENYALDVSVWEHSKDEYRKTEDVGEFTSVIKRYHADVTNADIDRVAERLRDFNFYNEQFTDKPDAFWTDGTTYVIEARLNNKYNIVARHSWRQWIRIKN